MGGKDFKKRIENALSHLAVMTTWAKCGAIEPERDSANIEYWAHDAFELLQELTTPRVMEPGEVFCRHTDGAPVLIEKRGGKPVWTLYSSYLKERGWFVTMMPNGELTIRKEADYFRTWRAWTMMPSGLDIEEVCWLEGDDG